MHMLMRMHLMDMEFAAMEAERARAAPVPKGVCPICRRHIGRGIHMHRKVCARDHARHP